jgi:hypothetical protein
MSEKQSAKSAADRQRQCRQRKRQIGSPSIPVFDRALREVLFASYQAGDLSIDIPDLVQAVVERVAGSADVTERGCRETGARPAGQSRRRVRRARPCCSLTIRRSSRT